MTFHMFTLLHGSAPDAMRVHSAKLSFRNLDDAESFARVAAAVARKHGASRVEIDIRQKLAGPTVAYVEG